MPVASGHPNYSGNLIQPHLSNRLLDRFACESMFTELTSGDFLGELKRCGDTIQFQRAPRAVVHPYIKNQKLKHDFLETDCVTIQASKGLYFNLKMDDVDKHQICNDMQLTDAYVNDALHQFKRAMEVDVLGTMACGADSANQGCCAGVQTQCYDLGEVGKPLCIDCDNFLCWLQNIFSVLMEACVVTAGHGMHMCGPGGGEPFITLPTKAYNVLMQALSKGNCCLATDGVPMVTGRIPERIHKFHIFVTDSLPYTVENGERVYQIIAGRRDATGFCTTMESMREVEHPDYFGCLYQGMMVWASAVLYPEALTLSRAKFESSC